MPDAAPLPAAPAPAAVLLLTSAATVSFGTCQVCLAREAGQLIGGVPWCGGCRERYHTERPDGIGA